MDYKKNQNQSSSSSYDNSKQKRNPDFYLKSQGSILLNSIYRNSVWALLVACVEQHVDKGAHVGDSHFAVTIDVSGF